MKKNHELLIRFFSSNWLTIAIICAFILQALWIAISFKFPMLYDETAHVSFIQSYSEQLTPYTEDTPGNMTVQVSLYHYFQSFVLRITELFTSDFTVQIITMRVVSIIMFASGFYLVARLLDKISIKRSYTNLALIVFTLLPITTLVGATINYDNLLFPVTVLYLLVATNILQRKKNLSWRSLAVLISIGCFASLVKYTFLPIFFASLIYLSFFFYIRERAQIHKLIKLKQFQIRSLRRGTLIITGVFIILVSLFSITYVRNVLVYSSIKPSCPQLYSHDECLRNGIYKRNFEARQTADERQVGRPDTFVMIWLKNMVAMTGLTGNSVNDGKFEQKGTLPFIGVIVSFGALICIGTLLYSWRSLNKNEGWYFLLTMFLVLVASVFAVNINGYYKSHEAFANQPRYLLSLLPIFIAMCMVALGYALRRHEALKYSFMVMVIIVMMTQGGGIVTHVLLSDESWYWNSSGPVADINETTRNVIKPLVKE